MSIDPNQLAIAEGVDIINTRQSVNVEVRETAIVIVATYDPTILTVVDEVAIQLLNEADAGNRGGYGFMQHALAKKVFEVAGGRPVWWIPQSEAGAAAASTGTITWAGTSTSAGTIYVRVNNEIVATLPVAIGVANTAISTSINALINAYRDCLVTSADAAGVDTLTAKSKGDWGEHITFSVNAGPGESEKMPVGITAAIVAMSGGSGDPDITDALTALGTGDNKNYINATEFVHGYEATADVITEIATYVGLGNEAIGLYEDINGRTFRTWYGDVQSGSAGLTAVRAIGDAHKSDRTSHLVCAPTSVSHPAVIAACAAGLAARIANATPIRGYNGQIMSGIDPGTVTDRWTDTTSNRDLAVKSGVATTIAEDGVLKLQDIISMYHPDSVSQSSNGFRRSRDLAITWNMLADSHAEFRSAFWQGMTIVARKSDVTDFTQRQYVRDITDINAALIGLVNGWAGMGYLFDKQYTLDYIASGQAVQLRPGGDGFTWNLRCIYGATSDIIKGTVNFDIAISVITG